MIWDPQSDSPNQVNDLYIVRKWTLGVLASYHKDFKFDSWPSSGFFQRCPQGIFAGKVCELNILYDLIYLLNRSSYRFSHVARHAFGVWLNWNCLISRAIKQNKFIEGYLMRQRDSEFENKES